ncbi:hypothetical protein B0I37DRAFT_430992 [Chaetomium sp. MPI-CAGE-AT-0009]|nr:hypothetical protein B0I37DRAFT_430992 [Chaetomium sp. MPI-CAGE-AT-0009]
MSSTSSGLPSSHSKKVTASAEGTLPPQTFTEESLPRRVDLINQTSHHVKREAQAGKFQADESWKEEGYLLPGQQPKPPSAFACFDIPMNARFCGREHITRELHKHLVGPENNPLPGGSVLIHGLGGMGKSSIAAKFVYDCFDIYNPFIFWFSADTRQKATATAAQFCKQLGIDFGDPANESTKAVFTWRTWLEQNDSWLVIYDNVEDEALLRDLWPRSKKGTIIVTSRRPDITGTLVESGKDIAVPAMSVVESRHLLFKLLPPEYASLSADLEQVSVVDQFCELLNGLPLAIVLAAAFIQQTMRPFDETLKLLTEKRELLMRWPLPNDAVASLPLGMLWEANIASLPDAARRVLQVMAFLDPDGIQEEMLLDERVLNLHDVLPANRKAYLHCLGSLSSYSLIHRDRSMLCVHRLVQDATILRMGQEDLRNALDAAVDLIWTTFPRQSENGLLMSSVLHLTQSYLPHVEALAKRSMYERGLFGPSVKLARTGLDIATALQSETRLLRADLWTVIGGVQLEGTGLKESYQSLKLALDLRLEAVQAGLMDEKHPQSANSYMSLGTAAIGIGRVQEALELGEQSISQRSGRPDGQIQMFAMTYHNVALAALYNGQLDKADAFINKSVELTSVTSQRMTPEQKLAMDSRNIYCQGNILWARGMKQEAREHHQRALEVRIRTFGEAHPYTACAYWKLGSIWEEDDWRKAETHYEESVKLYKGLTNVEPHLGRTLYHLGRLCLKHGVPRGQEAIAQAERLYKDITDEEFPKKHDDPFENLVHPFYS